MYIIPDEDLRQWETVLLGDMPGCTLRVTQADEPERYLFDVGRGPAVTTVELLAFDVAHHTADGTPYITRQLMAALGG